MIIVEVQVPCLDKTYEFKLNEDVIVAIAIEEIVSVICQKEQFKLFESKSKFLLYNMATERQLSVSLSLFENGVCMGDKLILV